MMKTFTHWSERTLLIKEIFLSVMILAGSVLMNPLFAQGRSVTGKVLDENNDPIPGASVLIKGTSRGAATDLDGDFSLTLTAEENILEISFIGYDKKEVVVGNQSVITVSLTSDTQALSEVVVTAFGMEREKKALGYSTQSIDGSALSEARQGNIANNLSGRVAGVQINSNSMPGSGSHIVIRGSSSVAGNNEPLVVVEGGGIFFSMGFTHGY